MINQRGSFVVSRSLILNNIEKFAKIIEGFVPLHIETDLYEDTVTYYGVHPEFEEVNPGLIAPKYEPMISSSLDGTVYNVKWKQVVDIS
jgi:hypothetical protein